MRKRSRGRLVSKARHRRYLCARRHSVSFHRTEKRKDPPRPQRRRAPPTLPASPRAVGRRRSCGAPPRRRDRAATPPRSRRRAPPGRARAPRRRRAAAVAVAAVAPAAAAAAVAMGRISYYYDPDVGNFYYAQGHPMKPHRMRMTHNLLVAYGLTDKLNVFMPPRAAEKDMTRFHADDYIQFLKTVTPDSVADHHAQLSRFNVVEDCPVFDGLWEYCQIAAGGSLAGAARLNSGESDIAINWAGGLHHAKKAEASGFCYINDCVLAILELLKVHARVLYIDIDIHHGDGVEEAFYSTDRVMTASFHKFGGFFPGTGAVSDTGVGRGKSYAVNFPLKDGIDDESYREIFVPVMSKVMEWYQPGAVVLQCGADSLTGDRLGCFNLTLRGHAHCVDFFKAYGVPLLLLGGGGYTVRNVARCWAYETSRVVGADLSDGLPFNDNLEFYAPEFRLHIVPSNMENHNTRQELDANKAEILEHLRNLPFAPSVPVMDTPRASPLGVHERDADSDGEDPDVRHRRQRAKMVVDYEDSDDELINGGDDLRGNLPIARRRLKAGRTGAIFAARRSRSPSKALPSTARDTHSPPRLVPAPMPAPLPFPAHAPSGSRKHPSILYPSSDYVPLAESAARAGPRNPAKEGSKATDGLRPIAVSPRAPTGTGFKRKDKRSEAPVTGSGVHVNGRSSDGPLSENAVAKGSEGIIEKHPGKASSDRQRVAANAVGNELAENEVFRSKWKKSEPQPGARIGGKSALTDGHDDDSTKAVASSSVEAMDIGEVETAPKNLEKGRDKNTSPDGSKFVPPSSDALEREKATGESSVVEKKAENLPSSLAAKNASLDSPRHSPLKTVTEGSISKDVSMKPAEASRALKEDKPAAPDGEKGDAVMEDVEDAANAEVQASVDGNESDKRMGTKGPEKLSNLPTESENERASGKDVRESREKLSKTLPDSEAVSESPSASKGQLSERGEKSRSGSDNLMSRKEKDAQSADHVRPGVDGRDKSTEGGKKSGSSSVKKSANASTKKFSSPSATEKGCPPSVSPKNPGDAPKVSKRHPDDEEKDEKMVSDAEGSVGQDVQAKVRDTKTPQVKPTEKSASEKKPDAVKGEDAEVAEAEASEPALSKATEKSSGAPPMKEKAKVSDLGCKKDSGSDAVVASKEGEKLDKTASPSVAGASASASEEKARGEKPKGEKSNGEDEARVARKEEKAKREGEKKEAATEKSTMEVDSKGKGSAVSTDSSMPPPRPPFPTLGLSRFPLPGMPPPPPKSPSAGLIPQASPPPVSPAPARKRWAPAGTSAPPTRRPSGSPVQSSSMPSGSSGPPPRRPSGSPGTGSAPAFRSEPAPSLTPSAAVPVSKSSALDKDGNEQVATKKSAKPAESASPASDVLEKKSAQREESGGRTDSAEASKKVSPTEARPSSDLTGESGKSGRKAVVTVPAKTADDESANKEQESVSKGTAPGAPKPAPGASSAPLEAKADNRTVGTLKIMVSASGEASASIRKPDGTDAKKPAADAAAAGKDAGAK